MRILQIVRPHARQLRNLLSHDINLDPYRKLAATDRHHGTLTAHKAEIIKAPSPLPFVCYA